MSVSEKKEKESWECVYFSLQFNFNGCGRGQACEKQTWTVNLSSKNRVHREKKKIFLEVQDASVPRLDRAQKELTCLTLVVLHYLPSYNKSNTSKGGTPWFFLNPK